MTTLRLLILSFLFSVFFVPVGLSSEVCKDALRKYDEARLSDAQSRKKVLEACKEGHGGNALLPQLLRWCDKLSSGKAPKENIEKCKIDAYRFIGWSEYP